MASGEGLGSPVSPETPPEGSPEEAAAAAAQTPDGSGTPEVRHDPAKGDQEQDTEKDKGAAKEPVPGGSATESQVPPGKMARGKTCRILFAGRGYATWDELVQKTIQELNPRQAMAGIEETIAEQGYHVSEWYLDGDRLVVVEQGPGDLTKRKGRKDWLDWWTGLQPEVIQSWGRVKMLISPSDEYDKWIKFVGGVMSITVSCRDPAVRPVLNHPDYKEVLEALVEYHAGPEASGDTGSETSDVHSTGKKGGPEGIYELEDGFPLAGAIRTPEWIKPDGDGTPDPPWTAIDDLDILDSTALQMHGENLRVGAVEELALTNRKVTQENTDLRRQNQKYREEWEEVNRKSTFKTNRDAVKEERDSGGAKPSTPGGSTPEHRPKLKAISNPTKTRTRPGGTTIITWVGNPWMINGDVLLVVTDWDLNILNIKFWDQLVGRVGRGYQPEIRLIKNQDKKALVVVSGGNTPYWAIIHLPARNIRPGEELPY